RRHTRLVSDWSSDVCSSDLDRHVAEDLTQETFLKAFAALAKFQAGSNFRAWLFRIAHNSFINLRRAARRQREGLPEDLPAREAEIGRASCRERGWISGVRGS